MDDLKNLRAEIDSIDKKLSLLFEKRMDVVSRIVQYKLKNNMSIYQKDREDEVLEKITSYINDKSLEKPAQKFFESLMKISKEQQERILKDK